MWEPNLRSDLPYMLFNQNQTLTREPGINCYLWKNFQKLKKSGWNEQCYRQASIIPPYLIFKVEVGGQCLYQDDLHSQSSSILSVTGRFIDLTGEMMQWSNEIIFVNLM